MRSVFDDNDFNKRGQTSRLVAWPPIQTSCNIEKIIHSYNNPLGWFYPRWDNILCEPPCNFLARQYRYITLHSHLDRFLFENFPYTSIQPHSATAMHLASTVKPSNSTEHGSIQKGSIKYTVDTSNISGLLSAVFFALIITPQGDPLPYYLATQSGLVFLYLNSSLNPLLYCWKIKEVRQAVKDTIKQVSCSFF